MGARDLLAELTGAGLSVAAEGDRLVIRPASKLTDSMRADLREAKPALLKLLSCDRPHLLNAKAANDCHAGGWNDGEISRFEARKTMLQRRGLPGRDAEDLAERLTLRDRDSDDRRLCLECSWLGDKGRCLAASSGRLPDVGRRHKPAQTLLHRCGAFGLRRGLL